MSKVYQIPRVNTPFPSSRAVHSGPAPFPFGVCFTCQDTREIEVWCPENGKDYIPCEVCQVGDWAHA
ncbi:MAG: hypothetical protein K0Q50_202 [Vampirovibrio sp.]|jgi:hypothetical protein|nr:hypothetical protein [Vampirovibrio sp.]